MRTTGVKLEAETAKYSKDVEGAAKVTRGLKGDVEGLGKSSEVTGRKVDNLGGDFRDTARDAHKLQNEIQSVQRSLAGLAVEFAAASSASDRLDLTKSIRKQQGELRNLLRVEKLLPSPEQAAPEIKKVGRRFGVALADSITTGIEVVKSGPVLVAAAVAAAPLIGASVAAAVVGGAGVGGVVGGLVLASKDPRVQAAGQALGQDVMADLTKRSSMFIEPALRGVDKVRDAWALFDRDLDRIMISSAKMVDPLIDGLLSGALKVGHGFADAVAAAQPVIDELGHSFDEIGGAAGDFLTKMSRQADDGALAIHDLTGQIVGLVDTVGSVTAVLADAYGVLSRVNGSVKDLTGGLTVLQVLDVSRPLKELYNGIKGVDDQTSHYSASVRIAGADTLAASGAMGKAAQDADVWNKALKGGAITTDLVTMAQTRLKDAQDGLGHTLDGLGGKMSIAGQRATALRQTMDNLYGASIRQTDANEDYEASFDDLSSTVKDNAGQFKHNADNLNIHTRAGRTNRDALEALLTKNNELYIADIDTGKSVEYATGKHKARTEQVRKEAEKVHLNKRETDDLIGTYGRIPKKKTTDLVLAGVNRIADALRDLYVFQRALADGIPIASEIAKLRGEKGPAKKYGGYHTGGYTGEGDKYEPAGVVHRKEWVLRSEATSRIEREHPGLLKEMNATGQVPGYAVGGMVLPVDTSRRWPFRADMAHTDVPSRAEARSHVVIPFGNWPSSPGAQRGDSGVWHKIVALINSTGPFSGHFGNAYRAGDPLWHGSGRAVDWMGYNQDRLASFLAARRPLELIHRTNHRDYAYTRGRNMGSFNESLMNAHRNHVHIAMANGGVIREPVFGVGRSGATYSIAERGPETVIPGGGSAGGAGGTTVNVYLTANLAAGSNPREHGQQIANYLQTHLAAGGEIRVNGVKVLGS